MQYFENNRAALFGRAETDYSFSHEVFGERFYRMTLAVTRSSGRTDHLPVVVSERLTDVCLPVRGCCVLVTGQFRSLYRTQGDKRLLLLFIFARSIDVQVAEGGPAFCPINELKAEGLLYKPACLRETADGRMLSTFILASGRAYMKTDYLPCVCWGRNAIYLASLKAGARLRLEGRIQSRQVDRGRRGKRVLYEVSVTGAACLSEREAGA